MSKEEHFISNISEHGISHSEYENHIVNERNQFNKNIYAQDLMEKPDPTLNYLLTYFKMKKVKEKTRKSIPEHIISRVNQNNKHQRIKILSLGSGPGGYEMFLAKHFKIDYELDCIDINEKMMNLGKEKAIKENLNFNFILQDINKLSLAEGVYDVIISHAALHHMINHEHIVDEIKKSMKNDGTFFVQEIITKNGWRMWDETKKIANELWTLIPEKYKFNCLDVNRKKQFFDQLPDVDYSKKGFECIRSQDLYPILKNAFKTKFEVPGFAFARRFFSRHFGANYDLNNPTDKAIIDLIIKLDEQYSLNYNLKPENVFLVLEKN